MPFIYIRKEDDKIQNGMTGKKIQKEETQMTENLTHVTRPAVYGMFKSQEKVKEIKVE
jgi:hypothetical protein